ncbi:ethylene receptor 2-like [Camellia sinensis]|uniref:Response regulatory domain-containing protein n=2 Tax=Camellia sinensis var. sinensis TaxID=542762 RepID=A0A4S4EBN5_CAMSN|nr:ethylene receptor 2-like [Camellia sinensis]THG13630.1 hypothetical protein TEA_024066 [Camellia sinensis var. sinensis]
MSSSSLSFSSCDENDAVFFLPNTVSFWTLQDINHCQKLSELLTSLSFFSIPLEFLFFLSSSSSFSSSLFPHRKFMTQFAAFMVLSGVTHFVSAFTHSRHSFQLLFILTLFKIFTALLSCATSFELAKLIPRMMGVMVRQGLLVTKTREVGREIGLMRKQAEASWLALMLSREIRKSLDRHTVLETCVAELSKAFSLDNCAIWLPDESNTAMVLSHESRRTIYEPLCVPIDDPEMAEILARKGVGFLKLNSKLGNGVAPGVAIRLPAVEPCYGILVLVLPEEGDRIWSSAELEIVEGVADQVAVALSHAAIIEESLLIREKLMEQNIALHRSKELAMNANEAMCSFWAVMSREMIRPSQSIAAIMSVLQIENWVSEEQRKIVDTMAKVGLLLSGLIEDATGDSGLGCSRIELKSHAFSLNSMLKEVASVGKLMCDIRGLNFEIQVCGKVSGQVIGDEMRIIQAILLMVVKILGFQECGTVFVSVVVEDGSQEWKQYVCKGLVLLKFEIRGVYSGKNYPSLLQMRKNFENNRYEDRNPWNGFSVCEKMAKLMHGSASIGHNSKDLSRTLKLTIRLPIRHSHGGLVQPRLMDPETVRCLLKGMKTSLADSDGFNQYATRKHLENMGCHLTTVSSWGQCLETLRSSKNYYHLLLIDLDIFEEEGSEVIAQIRKLRLESCLRIVVLTSRSDSDIWDRCVQYGFHGVIRKPIVLQEMEDELQRIFHQTRVHSPPIQNNRND